MLEDELQAEHGAEAESACVYLVGEPERSGTSDDANSRRAFQ